MRQKGESPFIGHILEVRNNWREFYPAVQARP